MMSLTALYSAFASHKEARWILKPGSASKLYGFVKETQPKKILELGTGIGLSTAVVALALEKAGVKDYEIHTVEQTEKCYKLAQELVPEELRRNVKFYRVDAVLETLPDIPDSVFSCFRELPEGEWDLIIMDGPGPFLSNDKLIEALNGDVVKMHIAGKIKPGAKLYVDGRVTALSILERFYSDNFLLLTAPGHPSAALERKNNSVRFKDDKRNFYEQAGYFA